MHARGLALITLFVLAGVTLDETAGADEGDGGPAPSASPTVVATASCEKAVGPGRVRCTAEVRPSRGDTLRWADMQIVETPAFVSALKGRVGPADAVREPDKWRFSFGLVARTRGAANVSLRVRAVVCRGESCRPEIALLAAPVTVGD